MAKRSISLLLWGEGTDGADEGWTLGAARSVHSVDQGAAALAAVVAGHEAPWVLFWDRALGRIPTDRILELTEGTADAYHAGLLLGAAGQPDDLDVVHPTWYFTIDASSTRRCVCWRLTLSALVLRTDVVAQLGGLDPAFRSREAAGLDLGWRMLRRGAIPVHEPSLVAGCRGVPAAPLTLDDVDRYVLLGRHLSRKWVRYAAVRRAMRSRRPWAEMRALRAAEERAAGNPSPLPAGRSYERPGSGRTGAASEAHRVSVILPTLGRYELVGRVLEDLRAQTVAPAEIICVDQTRPHEARAFEPFGDLPLTVVAQDGLGQWLSRNEALRLARHDYLLLLDDDSHVAPDFVQRHIECLEAYEDDISAGASLSAVGAPIPENYGFYRVADQFDSGNALVRRDLLERVGAFDRQFDRMRAGDAEFGLRAQLAGALSVHNPDARRTHYKAAAGGLRSFGSWDVFRQRGLLSPLPLPSVVYFAMRYFSPRQVREHMVIGLAAGLIPYDRKRRARRSEWVRAVALFSLTAPLQAARVWRSVRSARRMLAEGPRIPSVRPAGAVVH